MARLLLAAAALLPTQEAESKGYLPESRALCPVRAPGVAWRGLEGPRGAWTYDNIGISTSTAAARLQELRHDRVSGLTAALSLQL